MTGSERGLPPMHPGEVLREEFMEPFGLTSYSVAKMCRVPRTRIERIAREESGITADTALRLAKLFGTTPEFWMNLQNRYEMAVAEPAIRPVLEQIPHSGVRGGIIGGYDRAR